MGPYLPMCAYAAIKPEFVGEQSIEEVQHAGMRQTQANLEKVPPSFKL